MNEIMKTENNDTWDQMKEKASMLVRSGFLPIAVNSPEKAIAIMMAGRELGILPMEAFRSIHVIQGKPTVSPQLMLALANRTGQLEDIQIDSKPDKCTVTVTRKGRKPHTEVFGTTEATRLGLMAKDNYQKQAPIMYRWRALAANLRVTFPDVLLGLYTSEELGADVKVIDENSMEVSAVQPPIPQIENQQETHEQPKPKSDILDIKSIVLDAQARISKNINPKTGQATNYFLIKDFQGQSYSTFDKKIYDFAKKAMEDKSLCVFKYRQEGRFMNLVELLNVTIEEPEEMENDAIEPTEAEIVEG